MYTNYGTQERWSNLPGRGNNIGDGANDEDDDHNESKKNEIWFEFMGKVMRFTNFCLINVGCVAKHFALSFIGIRVDLKVMCQGCNITTTIKNGLQSLKLVIYWISYFTSFTQMCPSKLEYITRVPPSKLQCFIYPGFRG